MVISSNTGTVDAAVITDKQEPSINTTFVLVPSQELRFRNDLYRTGATDTTGHLHLDGVPPGDYKAFAWEEVENGAWQDRTSSSSSKTGASRYESVRIPPQIWN